MHAEEVHAEVHRLVEMGLKDRAIACRLALPRTTVRDIRRDRPSSLAPCLRCWRPIRQVGFAPGAYAELLGLYLGDGHISDLPRTQRLRISLDRRHPQIVARTRDLVAACFPENRTYVVDADDGATAVVRVYSSHLGCVFPQHGAGKKHDRRIELEEWQRTLVEAAPWALLRGLVHSDGCFFINRTGRYKYLSVAFKNKSADIRELFAETCERVGVRPRMSGDGVRIYRRGDVADFAAFVGAKW